MCSMSLAFVCNMLVKNANPIPNIEINPMAQGSNKREGEKGKNQSSKFLLAQTFLVELAGGLLHLQKLERSDLKTSSLRLAYLNQIKKSIQEQIGEKSNEIKQEALDSCTKIEVKPDLKGLAEINIKQEHFNISQASTDIVKQHKSGNSTMHQDVNGHPQMNDLKFRVAKSKCRVNIKNMKTLFLKVFGKWIETIVIRRCRHVQN